MTIDFIRDEILNKSFYIEQVAYSGLNVLLNACNEYLSLYETLWRKLLGFKKPFLSEQVQIAQVIYYTTPSDYEKKLKNRSYYRGNCSAFSIVFQNILHKLQDENIQESASRKLKGLILKYIKDSLRLINHYQSSIGNDELFYRYISSPPDFSVYYDTCNQIIFGEVNFDDSSDQSEVTPALIRVMIELRLKWSMGISGHIVGHKPGNMSDFLEVYRSFVNEKKVIISPEFHIIKRIYEWGNIYIHTGTRSYAWLTGFAVLILEPFFYGERDHMSGVRIESLATIYEFWDALKEHYASRSSDKEIVIKIFLYKPGFICTNKDYSPMPCKNHYAIYEDVMSKARTNKAIAAYSMKKCILEEGNQAIGNALYERVRSSYISLREQEIRERAYYLWLQRGSPLWDADCDWYLAVENDIAYLPIPA